MGVICKFQVNKVVQYSAPMDTGEIYMSPVYGSTPGVDGNSCKENHVFGKYTPSGEIRMNIQNPDAFKQFKPGSVFYVLLTPEAEGSPV